MLADIPGLIEGAHEGAGLGARFLGHVERCAVLLHLVDGAAGDVVRAWRTVREELEAYGGGLADKPELIGLNKLDAMTPREASARRTALAKASGQRVMLLSGATGEGVPEVLRALQSMINAERQGAATGKKLPLPLREGSGEGAGPVMTPTLASAQRLVVKIGSALVVDQEEAAPRTAWLDGVAADIASLRARGVEVIVVSSGAIALARRSLGLHQRRLRLEEQQAAAAVGQIRLAQAWSEALSTKGLTAAQLLLTLDDTEDRRRYLNARATLNTLLGLGCVPVINENDTVATTEIRFGDNDRLAARVAEMMQADQLVLLSDIDGLYSADPRRDPSRRAYSDCLQHHARDRGDGWRTAARLLVRRHANQVDSRAHRHTGRLCDGDRHGHADHPLAALESGARCTWFLAAPEGRSARKRWIAGALAPLGTLVVDAGAARALAVGRSLLPAGVRAVEGTFQRGDPVVVRSADGKALARGLSAYTSGDAERIAGHRSDEIEAILGWRGRDEIIHRDDLVLL